MLEKHVVSATTEVSFSKVEKIAKKYPVLEYYPLLFFYFLQGYLFCLSMLSSTFKRIGVRCMN